MSRSPPIYLDYASTTPLDPRVADEMQAFMRRSLANPASQHQAGRSARRELEMERDAFCTTAGAHGSEFVFTSGGTEANNLAVLGLAGHEPCRIIVSSLEHPSVQGPCEALRRRGFQVDRIHANTNGEIDLEHLRVLLMQAPSCKLVSVMLANNETGVIQPVQQAATLAHEQGAVVHVDAVQSVKEAWTSVIARGAPDAVTLSAHKLGGPTGIGGLMIKQDLKIEPQLHGGFQQRGVRPGTESPVLIHGFLMALLDSLRDELQERVVDLRNSFEERLLANLPDLVVNGSSAKRVPHISNIAFLGCDRQQLFLALDFAGVYCSTGSACASGSSEPSPVLRAMGLPEAVISSSLRFSFGALTSADDIEGATSRIIKCVKDLRARKSARNSPRTASEPT